jgi:hypothetical protein
MIISSITKGLSGLFIETLLFAQNMHLLNEAIETCDDLYPSIMELIRRVLPTYPQHAARRCQELEEVEETMLVSGLTPRIVCAVREVMSALASADWSNHGTEQWTISEMIREIDKEGPLQPSKVHSSQSSKRQDKNGLVSGKQPITIGDRSSSRTEMP